MVADSSINIQFTELNHTLGNIYNNDDFKKKADDQLDGKITELISILKTAFAAYTEQLTTKAKGPSLSSLRELAGISVVKDETLPLRRQFLDLWTRIGHLSHQVDLDDIFNNNPDIKKLVSEVSSIAQVEKEVKIEAVKKLDLNALRESMQKPK